MEHGKSTPPAYTEGDWTAYRHDDGSWCVHAINCIRRGGATIDFDHELATIPFKGKEAEANARIMAAAPAMRTASQRLYDTINEYLLGCDEVPPFVEAAFDEMEVAWHKADGTLPEQSHA